MDEEDVKGEILDHYDEETLNDLLPENRTNLSIITDTKMTENQLKMHL